MQIGSTGLRAHGYEVCSYPDCATLGLSPPFSGPEFPSLCNKNWTLWSPCCCVFNCSVVSDSLQPFGLQPASLLCPWNFSGKNTVVDSHSLFQGIFPTHRSSPCLLYLLHCRHILYLLSHQDSLVRQIADIQIGNKYFSWVLISYIMVKDYMHSF